MKVMYWVGGVLATIYPLAVYIGIRYQQFELMVFILLLALSIRLWGAKYVTGLARFQYCVYVGGLILTITAVFINSVKPMLFYPVIVNLCLFIGFSLSLKTQTPIITRLASLKNVLDESGRRYTRQLTKLWCLFFCINGSIAFMTTKSSLTIWTLYNGVISYCLIGSLLVGEWVYRKVRLQQ